MRGFTGRLQKLNIDPKFKDQLDSALQVQIRQATREWMRAIIEKIPQWSSQAVGTIKFAEGSNGFLSRYLNVAVPITGEHSRPNRNAESGGAFAHYQFTSQNHQYNFIFNERLLYFLHNDFFARTDPGAKGQQIIAPWGAFIAGQLAFESYLTNIGLKKLSQIQSAVVKTLVGIGS